MSFFFNQPDPKRRRFPIPNGVWKWELKPQGFAILAYLCYLHVHCNKNALPSADEIASQLHMSKDMAVKQIAELNRRGLLDQHMVPILKSFHEHRSRSHHGLRLSALLRGSPHTSVSSQLPHHLRCSTLDRVHCDEAHHEIGGQAVHYHREYLLHRQTRHEAERQQPVHHPANPGDDGSLLPAADAPLGGTAAVAAGAGAPGTEHRERPVCPTVRRCVPSFGVWQSPCPTKGFQGRFGPLSEEISRTKEKAG